MYKYGHQASQNLGFSFADLANRNDIQILMNDLYSSNTFKDILQDELLITAFDYTMKEPRFFSKYFMDNTND